MEKLLFCVKCKSLMRKIEPLAEDVSAVQKVLVNQPQLFPKKDKMLVFNQRECKCGNSIITIEQE